MAFKSFITLFMFGLLDLMNSEKGRLKYSTIVVILIIFFLVFLIVFRGGWYILMLFWLM